MARLSKRVGVVLFQLGGPDSRAALEPFLVNLFSDPDIIDLPLSRLGRRALAKLIARARAKKAGPHYAAIGGHSPIRALTERQAAALEERLKSDGIEARCVVAMRYWHPFVAEAITQLQTFGVDELVLLPLYPQYSSTTTGSSLNDWNRHWTGTTPTIRVNAFYRDSLYIDALVERIDEALAPFPCRENVQLVFSAHGVPLSVIEKGDPYQQQIEETTALVMERGAWPNRHCLCYQSKVGTSRWLQPTLRSTLRSIAAQGMEDVCVVPISFVSDHVETLGEINHCARQEALGLGIKRFAMTEGLNDSPKFIEALRRQVLAAIGDASLIDQGEAEREPATLQVAAD